MFEAEDMENGKFFGKVRYDGYKFNDDNLDIDFKINDLSQDQKDVIHDNIVEFWRIQEASHNAEGETDYTEELAKIKQTLYVYGYHLEANLDTEEFIRNYLELQLDNFTL